MGLCLKLQRQRAVTRDCSWRLHAANGGAHRLLLPLFFREKSKDRQECKGGRNVSALWSGHCANRFTFTCRLVILRKKKSRWETALKKAGMQVCCIRHDPTLTILMSLCQAPFPPKLNKTYYSSRQQKTIVYKNTRYRTLCCTTLLFHHNVTIKIVSLLQHRTLYFLCCSSSRNGITWKHNFCFFNLDPETLVLVHRSPRRWSCRSSSPTNTEARSACKTAQ